MHLYLNLIYYQILMNVHQVRVQMEGLALTVQEVTVVAVLVQDIQAITAK